MPVYVTTNGSGSIGDTAIYIVAVNAIAVNIITAL